MTPKDGERGSTRARSGLLANAGKHSITTKNTPEPTKAKDHANFQRKLSAINTTNLGDQASSGNPSFVNHNVNSSFQTDQENSTNPQGGAIRPWLKQLYQESRNEPPMGTRNILGRNNSPQKIHKSHMDRNSYIYDHPELKGLICTEIQNKLAYISDNPLINELTKKSKFVRFRKDQIKTSE